MYHRSHSPSSYSDIRGRSAFSRALNYNDLGLSSTFVPRNRSVQRVMSSGYTRRDHSRSPPRDISSPLSRIATSRPISDSLTSDLSPVLRRRELGLTASENIASSSNWSSSDDFTYKKPKTYYDLSCITPIYNTYSSSIGIKKPPKRTDYSDYLRPALQSRPMLKTNYIPRSRAERESVVSPLIRERKLIKFREISNDIMTRVRRKISWDITDDTIDSPLINEMKKNEALNESLSERIRSRDSSLNRYGSKERLTTPETRSPTCLSRRSSDKSIDGMPIRNLRLKSPRNSTVFASLENDAQSIPIPPPRKKSLGSILPKKKRKASLENSNIDEKSLNYSLIADKILRDRRLSDAKSKEANIEPTLPAVSDADNKSIPAAAQSDNSESVMPETEEERGRRRRRRDNSLVSSPESDKLNEIDGCRSRTRQKLSNPEEAATSPDNSERIRRKHRKSVKHKMGEHSSRRLSKTLDEITKSPFSVPISETSELNFKEKHSSSKFDEIVPKDIARDAKKDTLVKDNSSSQALLSKKSAVDEKDLKSLGTKKPEVNKAETPCMISDKSKHSSFEKSTQSNVTPEILTSSTITGKETKANTNKTSSDLSDKLKAADKSFKPKSNEAVIDKKKEQNSFSTLAKESEHLEKTNSNSQTKLDNRLVTDNTRNKANAEVNTDKSSKIFSPKGDKEKIAKLTKSSVGLHENDLKKEENIISKNLTSNDQNFKTEAANTVKKIDNKLLSQNNTSQDIDKEKEIKLQKFTNIDKKMAIDKSSLEHGLTKNHNDLKDQLSKDIKSDADGVKKTSDSESKMLKEEKQSFLKKELENKIPEKKILEDISDKKDLKILHSKIDKSKQSEKLEIKTSLSIAEDKKKIVKTLDLKLDSDKLNSSLAQNTSSSNLKAKINDISLSIPPKEKSVKDPYEVVVVCKLPQPKPKTTTTNSKANENVEIKPNTKLESATNKFSMKQTEKLVKDSLPESTIPIKQPPVVTTIPLLNKKEALESSKSTKSNISDKPEGLEVNVSHVVILKPKAQITKPETKPVKEVTVSCPVLLKPIPDIVQSTIKIKTEKDIKSSQSDQIKSQVTNKTVTEKSTDIPITFDNKIKADKTAKLFEGVVPEKSLTDSKVPDLLVSSNEKRNLNLSKPVNVKENRIGNEEDSLKTDKQIPLSSNLTKGVKKLDDENNLTNTSKNIQSEISLTSSDNQLNKQTVFDNLNKGLSAELKKDIYSKEKNFESKPAAVKKVVRRSKTAENIDTKLDKFMEVKTTADDIKDVSSRFYKKSSTAPNMNTFLNKGIAKTEKVLTNESVLNKSESSLVALKENASKISEKPDVTKTQTSEMLPKLKDSKEKVPLQVQQSKISNKLSNEIKDTNDKSFTGDIKTAEKLPQTSKNTVILNQVKTVQTNTSETSVSLNKLEMCASSDKLQSSEAVSQNKQPDAFLKQRKSKSDDSIVLESNSKTSKLENLTSKEKQKSLDTISEIKKVDKILNHTKPTLEKKSSILESSKTSNSEVTTSTEKLKTSGITSQIKKSDEISKQLENNSLSSKPKDFSTTSKLEGDTNKLKTLETAPKTKKIEGISKPLENNFLNSKPKDSLNTSKLEGETDKLKTSETTSKTKKSDEISKQLENNSLASKSKVSSNTSKLEVTTDKLKTLETTSKTKKSDEISKQLENNSLASKPKESPNTSKLEVTADKLKTLETASKIKKTDEATKPIKTVLENNSLVSKPNLPSLTSNSVPLKDKQNCTETKETNLKPAIVQNKNIQDNLQGKNIHKTNENSKTALIKTLGMPCISEVNETPKLEKENVKVTSSEPLSNKSEKVTTKQKIVDEKKQSGASKMDVNGNCEGKTDRARVVGSNVKDDGSKDIKVEKKPEATNAANVPPKKPLKTPVAKLKKTADLPPSPRPTRYGLILSTIPRYISSSSDSDSWDSSSSMSSLSSDDAEEPSDEENYNNAKENSLHGKQKKSVSTSESSNKTITNFANLSFDESPQKSSETTKKIKFRNYGVDDFTFLKLLGKGSFGKVLLAELKDQNMFFAIKCLKKDVVLEDDDVESTMIERRVLALGTQHPYMCKLYCTFQTKSYLFFVMEYLNGGDLMFHIQNGRFDEERSMFYAAEIVSALQFLHKRGIIYRDIKLDNIIFDEEGHVHLVDFGMCKPNVKDYDKTATFCGTPDYIPPEIIRGSAYNQSVDWWSFGVLLFEMILGRSPFVGTDEDELFWSICNEEPSYSQFLSRNAKDILQNLLIKTPNLRIGMPSSPAGEIRAHPFFRSINWEKLERMEIPPPFKPIVLGASDVNNFDRSFTQDSATLSPIDSNILASMDQDQFHGFSYTNPHIVG